MQLTLKSALKKYEDSSINIHLGQNDSDNKLDYSRLAMLSLIVILGVSMIATMGSILVEEDIISKLVSLIIFLICGFLLLNLVKEKSNLDLLSTSFEDLSSPAKEEIIKSIVDNNNHSSSQLVGLLETILEKVFPNK